MHVAFDCVFIDSFIIGVYSGGVMVKCMTGNGRMARDMAKEDSRINLISWGK
jgi:hypothetical protein